jgi:NADPH:quinone reductase-like Zn-dependent oxidoreductase
MKAATINKWGSEDVFEFVNIPIPIPEDDQILIKVYASSVNPVDYKQRKGNHRFILGAPFPIILGYDVSGEVIKTGKNITQFKPGDMVFGDLDNKYGGALAEYAVAHEHCFALKPENVSFEEASALSLAGLTALQALCSKGGLKPGQTIIINGATGGVGHLALQIAKICDARTIAVASSSNFPLIQKLKPDRFVDYITENILKLDEKADIFFDVSGTLSFKKCLRILNENGKYISTLPRPKLFIHKMIQPFTKGKRAITLLRNHNADDMDKLAGWLRTGHLKPEIDSIFDFEQIKKAHNHAENSKLKGKVVISIQKT